MPDPVREPVGCGANHVDNSRGPSDHAGDSHQRLPFVQKGHNVPDRAPWRSRGPDGGLHLHLSVYRRTGYPNSHRESPRWAPRAGLEEHPEVRKSARRGLLHQAPCAAPDRNRLRRPSRVSSQRPPLPPSPPRTPKVCGAPPRQAPFAPTARFGSSALAADMPMIRPQAGHATIGRMSLRTTCSQRSR